VADFYEVSTCGGTEPRTSGALPAIAAAAGRQDGVISRSQLGRIGLTDRQIGNLVAWGYLLALHRGVYAVGHRRLTPRAHLRAALLATGPTAFLSHRTAAAVWGLRDITTRRIELAVPGCKRRSRGSLTIHHTADATLVTTRDGLRVSSVPRLLIELAPREPARELDRLITLAIRKRILNIDKMQEAVASQGRRPGLAKLRVAIADYLPRPDRKSDLERAFDALLAQHPEIPPPERNIHLHGWEIDCYWPEQRLAVELDGRPYHVAVKDIERDRLKDAKLLTVGIRVLRITDNRFEYDARDALEDVLAALDLSPS
jgi:Protein of unknown function (DUF559)